MSAPTLFKKPSAFIPVTMSLAAFAVVAVHVSIFGATREADEGAAAHVFQLLIAAQIPIVAFFVIKWLPQSPKIGGVVVALQVSAAFLALAPVFFLSL
jgi:hypothetical protein